MLLAKIPTFDNAKLAAIEQNAKRWLDSGTAAQKFEAEAVVSAITAARQQRKDVEVHRRKELAGKIRERVKDKGLFDRVVLAFSEVPPDDWEVEVLKEIAAGPGRDFDTLAHAIGKRGGGYINLAVGSLCSAREAYLGPAPPAKHVKDTKVYSALLIDFTPHSRPDGTTWAGWTLKPEAEAALTQLGVLK